MAKRVHIKTYGCQMNVYDSTRMAETLDGLGYAQVGDPAAADLVILNTCHIREKAAEKVYSDIGRLRALPRQADSQGERLIAVGGCVGQAEGAEIMRRAAAVNLVFGPQTYHRLPAMLAEAEGQATQGRRPRVLDTDFPADSKFDGLPKAAGRVGPSAFLTIQEGCDKFCSFCVVPYTRGAETSRPVAEVVTEAQSLVARGAREITLLGQNVNAYHGRDADGASIGLGALIRRLAAIDGLARLRYTTSHPRDVDDAQIAAHRDVAALMPYLHLPIQSGSDAILAAMNRRHGRDEYFRIIDRLRQARPDIALSSDIIVGFPGETDADFEQTMDLVRRVGYAQCYSFKYSPRPGTPGAALDDQVPEPVKAARLAALQDLLNAQQLRFNRDSIGRVDDILIERRGRDALQYVGRSPYMQAVHIALASTTSLDATQRPVYADPIGALLRCRITAAGPNSLAAEAVG